MTGISLIKYLLFVIPIFGLWFVLKERLRKKRLKVLLSIIPGIIDAIEKYEGIASLEFYFTYSIEQEYKSIYSPLRSKIPSDFRSVGLDIDSVNKTERFLSIYDYLKENRKNYNDLFVQIESEKFKDYLDILF